MPNRIPSPMNVGGSAPASRQATKTPARSIFSIGTPQKPPIGSEGLGNRVIRLFVTSISSAEGEVLEASSTRLADLGTFRHLLRQSVRRSAQVTLVPGPDPMCRYPQKRGVHPLPRVL